MITKPFALSLSKCEYGSTNSPRTQSFYCALALTNESERVIRQNIQIATDLKPFADDIADLPIADKKTELLELARVAKKEPEKAAVIVERLKALAELE